MSFAHPKRLLVEGIEDQYAIRSLMRGHIAWPDTKDEEQWPVKIEVAKGIDGVLDRKTIPTLLLSSGVKTVGVIVDADVSPEGRWQRLQQLCRDQIVNIPEACPHDGLVVENQDGQRLGLWIMPDNISMGKLESLLLSTIPQEQSALRDHADRSLITASESGAKFKSNDRDKALIHTWLAWQDPPGAALGNALLKNILDRNSASAATFVSWFCRLFQC